jgi:metal-sulfur cluster biosynthetic enzyme
LPMSCLTMRRHISVEIKRQVLRLAVVRGYKYKKVRELTGVNERTTKHLCALHQWIGDVVKKIVYSMVFISR